MTSLHAVGRPHSLRRRLLWLVSIATLLVWVVAAALSYRQARHEVRELMDSQMTQAAAFLLAQASHDPADLSLISEEMAAVRGARKRRNELALEFTLMDAGGTVLVRTPRGPALTQQDAPGYATIDHAGEPWRSLLLLSDKHRIRVAQSQRELDKEALEISTKTVLPLLLFMPLLLGLIYFSVRRGLKPLDELAIEVATRSPENLNALTETRVPREAQPLVAALNRLLQRLGSALENERRFTADAAHELRTPLAAIRIQSQVAMANKHPAEQQHALAQVVAGADRATRLVEQLLRLARLDPLAKVADPQRIDLVQLAKAACAAAVIEPARAADLTVELADVAAWVNGDPDLLAIALRNLLENALRYTQPGTRITVVARLDHGEPLLAVQDAGRGVAAEELPKLIERFYRSRETTTEGNGLGLAIVRRIAELHRARLEVENLEGSGFVARLRWPGNHQGI